MTQQWRSVALRPITFAACVHSLCCLVLMRMADEHYYLGTAPELMHMSLLATRHHNFTWGCQTKGRWQAGGDCNLPTTCLPL